MRSTKAIINLALLRQNIRAIRQRIGSHPLICFPVKSNAYGHGVLPIVETALSEGVQYLGVATVSEGIELREASITVPILLFSIPSISEIPALIDANLIPFVADRDYVSALSRIATEKGKRLSVHLKVDTGMGRIGCSPESCSDLASFIVTLPSLEYSGTSTHFAVSDSILDEHIKYTKEQISTFQKALESIRSVGINPGICHACNSGGVNLYEEAYFDMVRPGNILYGYVPNIPPGWNSSKALILQEVIKPIFQLVTEISFLKQVNKGQSISYGITWNAPNDTIIGTLPVGYGDGLRRDLSGKLKVCIKGKIFEIVGRICMDQCMVDLGIENTFEKGEKVTVIGDCVAHAGEIGEMLGTISYEITCGINKRVPRVYVNE
jgi:alanine racemase